MYEQQPPADPVDSASPVDRTDPDIDASVSAPDRQAVDAQASMIAAIAAGGVIGACIRYGATMIWVTSPTAFPWTTFTVNVTGCAMMGVLMVLITDRYTVHPLVRPFAGTGVIGGFTTFSTYTVDIQRLLTHGNTGLALTYLTVTAVATVAALWAGATATRAALGNDSHRVRAQEQQS